MLNIKSLKNLCFNILIIIIISLGIFFRLSLYFKQMPFWYDERLLGTFFFDNNIFKFLFSIEVILKIPPLWGIINQIFLNIFGHSFLAFRFISFISGISAIFAFFFLLKNLFKDKIAILTGLFLFTLNPWLIFYSNEFKPYSCDVLVCILLLLSFKFISFKNISFRKTILYTLISMVIILFSFPAMFIIPAIILAKCIEEKHFSPKVILIFAGICSACLYLYLIDRDCYKLMVHDWNNYYSSFLEPSFSSFNLLINNFFNYIFNEYLNTNHCIIKYFIPVGLLFFFLNKQKEAFIFLFIILFALSASFLKLYPFGYRVSLYLFPVFIILIAKVIDFSYFHKNGILIFLKSVLIAILILYFIKFNPHFYSIDNIGNLMETEQRRYDFFNYSKNILNKVNNEDILIQPYTIWNAFCFYNKFLNKNIKETNILVYENKTGNQEESERELLKSVLENYDHSNNIWISGLKHERAWEVTPNNINIVEDELKKYNVKYTKTIEETLEKNLDHLFYTFKVEK